MLANPDLNPSTSVNRWILVILTFHFELIPVDNFEDWIDELYGFMHIINSLPYVPQSQCATSVFTSEVTEVDTARDCHGYGKTRGLEVMGLAGMGTVVNFGTPQHTVYPYRGIVGIPRVYYNEVSVIFIVLKLVFSHI